MANYPFPGGPLVDEPIGGTDNDLADSPVGGSSNTIVDSPRAGTSNILRDLDPVVVGAGYVPLNGTEPGIVYGVNLNNERVDVTGNHVIGNSVLYTANKSYDGQRAMALLPGTGGGSIRTTSGTAHQVPTANPVSYGGMYIINTSQTFDNAVLLSSSTTTGATNQNYGIRYTGTQTALQRVPGAVDMSYSVPFDTHVHIVVVEEAGRGSAKLYVNGVLTDTVIPADTGAVLGTNILSLGELAFSASTAANGWVSDAFVCAAELSDAEVLQFATNAFGGTPPAP